MSCSCGVYGIFWRSKGGFARTPSNPLPCLRAFFTLQKLLRVNAVIKSQRRSVSLDGRCPTESCEASSRKEKLQKPQKPAITTYSKSMSHLQAAGSSKKLTSKKLQPKKFPSEFENVFVARRWPLEPAITVPREFVAAYEKVLETATDRREHIGADRYPGIGLLRMTFSGKPFFGTASIFANGSCLLTSAHNVVEYDPTTKEFLYATNVWFEFRNNNGSAPIKLYDVNKIEVYPPYLEKPRCDPGFDLALCLIDVPEGDRTVKELYSTFMNDMPKLLAGSYSTTKVAVVGFPEEKGGEKWGMVADVPHDKREDWCFSSEREMKETLEYDFTDTTPGQSGSPVMGMKASDVLGVHTGGSAALNKNWATYITPAKLQWIADVLGSPWKVVENNSTLYLSSS